MPRGRMSMSVALAPPLCVIANPASAAHRRQTMARCPRSRGARYEHDVEEGLRMVKFRTLAIWGAVAAVTACATQSQQLATRQPAAVEAALHRGRFDLNCPTATATVLSQDYI